MDISIKYFLGSNSSEGFYSLFNELYDPEDDWKVYVIKGGPGCGKSTFMQTFAERFSSVTNRCEKVMCASDPESLDAVIFPCSKVAMVDGTAPHVVEPEYYGAVEEIINLGECLNTSILARKAGEIRCLFSKNKCCYIKATNYLKTAACLLRNSKRLQDEYIDYEKLYNYVIRFAKRELGEGTGEGKVVYRFFTAITNVGEVTFADSIFDTCGRIISIEDPIGAVSGQLLDCLLSVAIDCGINAIAGVSPYDTEEIEQLVFPDFGVAIVRQNDKIPATRTIHAARFINMEGLKAHKNRIAFNKKASIEFQNEAFLCLDNAKSIHDEIESIYVSAMDFEKLSAKTSKIMESITKCSSKE